MRISASISPPLRLFTCRRNEILAGIETCCRVSVPAVPMYLRLQTIVNVSQKSHSEHIYRPFARWGFCRWQRWRRRCRRLWSKLIFAKKIAGQARLVWISDLLVNNPLLDIVFGLNLTLQFDSGWGNEKDSPEPAKFCVNYQTDLNTTGIKTPDLLSGHVHSEAGQLCT